MSKIRQVSIRELKRGDAVYDDRNWYVIYAAPVMEDGAWRVDSTDGGDYICNLKDGDILWTEPPEGHPLVGSSVHPRPTSRFLQE